MDNLLVLFIGTFKDIIQHYFHISLILNPWVRIPLWKRELKVKTWLPKGFPLKPIVNAMFILLTPLKIKGLHLLIWMKEEK